MAHCSTTISGGPTLAEGCSLISEGLRLLGRGVAVWTVAVTDGIFDRLDRMRERRALGTMDDRALADLGLNRCDVDRLTN